MKLFLALLLLVGGYYLGLCAMTDRAMAQVSAIQHHYEAVGTTADAWQQDDTSATFSYVR